jgi:hypothetical protein
MSPSVYNLLTTVLGAFITGVCGIITAIITIRAQRKPKVIIERTEQRTPEPTESISRKGHSSSFLAAAFICVGALIGFFIGNATKKSPSVVRHYDTDVRRSIASERIAEINQEIHAIELERNHMLEQPILPESQAAIQNYDEKLQHLRDRRAEFEEIEQQAGPP